MAVQVYWPPSDSLRKENVRLSVLVASNGISVESGKTIFMSGSTTRPATTLAEHLKV